MKPSDLCLALLAVSVTASAGVPGPPPRHLPKPPPIIAIERLHGADRQNKRPVSKSATKLMEEIARDIVSRGGRVFSTRKGNRIVVTEEGFDQVDRLHLLSLSSATASSSQSLSGAPEEPFVTLTWRDDKAMLEFHGLEGDRLYEVSDMSSYEGLFVLKDDKDPRRYRIASSDDPMKLTAPVTGMPKDMQTAWFVPQEKGGLFIEKVGGRMISVEDQPDELGEHFVARVGPSDFVLMTKAHLLDRMSTPFHEREVVDRGPNYQVNLADKLDVMAGHRVRLVVYRLVDKKDPRVETSDLTDVWDYDLR